MGHQQASDATTEDVALDIEQNVKLRFLSPDDIPTIKLLCAEWFPIEYPYSWYEDITSNSKFYSLAATINNQVIGIIVSEIKSKTRCNREDADILAAHFPPSTQVAYILSLGVVSEFRRHGIASILLDSLLSFVTSAEKHSCKAVYLHVLTSNTTAIRFYERRNFIMHNFLPYYYSIQGTPRDGYSYVLYTNGGQPPLTILDYLSQIGSMFGKSQACNLPQRILLSVQNLWRKLVKSENVHQNQAQRIS